MSRPAEEMRPHEILAARDKSGCAFVPVSPTFEWHSFHLPMGTDALISERICQIAAEAVGGIWFRPLPLGLDEWRSEEQLVRWGFGAGDRVFGMSFPELPLKSEYNELPELRAVVTNRLHAIKDCGFRHAFIINNHGGTGQMPALEALAEECSTESFRAHSVPVGKLTQGRREVTDETLRVGGHAGLSETTRILAFRPELVDLTRQAEGELTVREVGILHSSPKIDARYNPRGVSLAVAGELRECIVANLLDLVREAAGLA